MSDPKEFPFVWMNNKQLKALSLPQNLKKTDWMELDPEAIFCMIKKNVTELENIMANHIGLYIDVGVPKCVDLCNLVTMLAQRIDSASFKINRK